jgi:hypothetical protein
MKKIICALLVIVVVFGACRKPIVYSDIPHIELRDFIKYKEYKVVGRDTLLIDGATLIFYFQDGEGDIGLNEEDTAQYNLFIDYYEKQDSVFVKIDSVEKNNKMEPFILHSRFPRLSKLPQESIHGVITHFMYEYYYDKSTTDSIKLKFFITDRKFNKSNVEEITTSKGF